MDANVEITSANSSTPFAELLEQHNIPANTPLREITFVFREPGSLGTFFNDNGHAATSQGSVESICIHLLQPFEGITEADIERERDVDFPDVQPVMESWVDAFRALPPSLRLVILDLTRGYWIAHRHTRVTRPLQHLSTVMHRRTEGRVTFRAVGFENIQHWTVIARSVVGLEMEGMNGWT